MKSYFDKLNLRPQERRLVVIVGLIFFVVLNIWFIFPKFGEWSLVSARMNLERQNLEKFQTEIAKRPQYEARLNELQSGGSEFLTNDLQFMRIVQGQASSAGLQVNSFQARAPVAGRQTTQFYQELGLNLNYTSGGKELVNFLVGIAAQNYMIRVREMNVRPDPSQTRLMGNLTLIANLQTNAPARPAAPAARPAPPATNRPAATKAAAGVRTATNNPASRPGTMRPNAPTSKAAAVTNRSNI
ncbi:MAG: hypothetical protein ACO1QB_05220 [Verrucomicrobiales bacterium]